MGLEGAKFDEQPSAMENTEAVNREKLAADFVELVKAEKFAELLILAKQVNLSKEDVVSVLEQSADILEANTNKGDPSQGASPLAADGRAGELGGKYALAGGAIGSPAGAAGIVVGALVGSIVGQMKGTRDFNKLRQNIGKLREEIALMEA